MRFILKIILRIHQHENVWCVLNLAVCCGYICIFHVHFHQRAKRIPLIYIVRFSVKNFSDQHPNNYVILVETSTEQPSQWHRSRLRHLRPKMFWMCVYLSYDTLTTCVWFFPHTKHSTQTSFVCVSVHSIR